MGAKPFVKWAGGKGQLLPEIRKYYPMELGKSITKYAEPFVGGGAVLFDILSNYDGIKEVYISDMNTELINTYQVTLDNCEELIERLKVLKGEFMNTPGGTVEQKKYYYQKRETFNAPKVKSDKHTNIEKAALFIFLNKTCFNGLYRVNRRGEFNVPMGSYRNPAICDEENLRKASALLKRVTIVCGDYKQSERFIDGNTFVYFDPPFRPLNKTANFNSYTEEGFPDEKQIELAKFASSLVGKGARVVVSNSDPQNVNPEDDFFDELYAKFIIHRLSATRMINSSAAGRGKISELLITNF